MLDLLDISFIVDMTLILSPVTRLDISDHQTIVASHSEPGISPDQHVTHTEHPGVMLPGGYTVTQPGHKTWQKYLTTRFYL